MKKLFHQLVRFGIVGGTSFLIDYSLLYLFTSVIGIHYLISSLFSFVISTVFNYILSIHWVFDVNRNNSSTRNFILFITFSVIGLGINELIMWIGVDHMHLYYMWVKIGATAIVMVFNFITRKLFLEK